MKFGPSTTALMLLTSGAAFFASILLAGVLFAAPVVSFATSPSRGISSYHMVVKGKVKFFNERLAQTFEAKGTAIIEGSVIGDVDSDGLPDVATEIVSMSLTGTTSRGLAVNLNSSKSNRSTGVAERLVRMPVGIGGSNIPANSFFDIFVELRHTPFHNSVAFSAVPDEALTSCEPVHLAGISRSLTDLSGVYRMSGKISLCNRSGEPVGSINSLAINLNSSKSN
ncbi:hypothetical protein HY971_03755 [Candidatus Kaiserbacteria bacterium]|nr:hypothetical protein [Candidatus Kaiserbacteria bacterium]